MTEQIDIDAGIARVAHWRGEPFPYGNDLYPFKEWTAAVTRADNRRRSIVYGLSLAQSQSAVLAEELQAARTTASRLETNLTDVKTTATIDLDNATAGDTTLTALTTLIAAIDAAVISLRAVPGLTYEAYRDE